MNGSIEGRCTNYKNSSMCNSDFIARSVLLKFFKVMCGFFMTTTKYSTIQRHATIRNKVFNDQTQCSLKYTCRLCRVYGLSVVVSQRTVENGTRSSLKDIRALIMKHYLVDRAKQLRRQYAVYTL